MAARFVDKAVDALADYLSTNYGTYLDAVETELSLAAGSLTDPKAFLRADIPFDNRNPRMDIFEEGWSFEDDFDDMMVDVDCAIIWSSIGDADIEAGELFTRRCHTALIECIQADRSLGGTVQACLLTDGSSGSVQEEKITRHAFKQNVTVRLQEVM